MMEDLYFRPPNRGPDCSTQRSARLRQRRFDMAYEQRQEPAECTVLAVAAREVFLQHEAADPALARALALRHVVENCPITPERDTLFLGGEDPFLFNLLLPALQADRHSLHAGETPTELSARQREHRLYLAACFEGHITPGLQYVLPQGISGIRARLEVSLATATEPEQQAFYRAGLLSCGNVLTYARRCREDALARAEQETGQWADDLRQAADWLSRVPEQPAETLGEALQSFWLAYLLVTIEMGGCCPGGGLGLGRLDQFLHPYYEADLAAGRLTRAEALELLELFLLCFRHCDYYTGHQVYTPGSQSSLGGVSPTGEDASNELTELLMEASLRIQMPAPYLSLRLHRDAPEHCWQAAANYVSGGLGFAVVNDEALIPAFLRHGRPLKEARDYICSCCYENTLPGCEAFHPNGCYLNLPLVLELALNEGRSRLSGQVLGPASPPLSEFQEFEQVLSAFDEQLQVAVDELVGLVNAVDERHCMYRRYPLMSLFIDDCIADARDVCRRALRPHRLHRLRPAKSGQQSRRHPRVLLRDAGGIGCRTRRRSGDGLRRLRERPPATAASAEVGQWRPPGG